MASANGKLILLGEHAVVYGVPALVMGIDRGARAVASSEPGGELSINGISCTDTETRRAFGALREALGVRELSVAAELALPPGAGLGASAALGVAIAKALLEHTEADPGDAERVLGAAQAWEAVFHGNPSGIDTSAAFYGRCFRYRRGHEPEFIPLKQTLRLAVGVAGPPASTRAMVEGVAKLRQRKPDLVDKSLEGIRSLVENATLCLQVGDLEGLGKLMDYNQMLLSGLFLSTSEIETACRIARDHGALGAKLTGAGGGGAVIALAEEPELIVRAWQERGIQGFSAASSPEASRAREPTQGGATRQNQ